MRARGDTARSGKDIYHHPCYLGYKGEVGLLWYYYVMHTGASWEIWRLQLMQYTKIQFFYVQAHTVYMYQLKAAKLKV